MFYLTLLLTSNRRTFLNLALQCCFFAYIPLIEAIDGKIIFRPISLFFKDLYNLLFLFSLIFYHRCVSQGWFLRFPQSDSHRHLLGKTDFLSTNESFSCTASEKLKSSPWHPEVGLVLTAKTWCSVERKRFHTAPTLDKVTRWLWWPTCTQVSAHTSTRTLCKLQKWPNIPYPG